MPFVKMSFVKPMPNYTHLGAFLMFSKFLRKREELTLVLRLTDMKVWAESRMWYGCVFV